MKNIFLGLSAGLILFSCGGSGEQADSGNSDTVVKNTVIKPPFEGSGFCNDTIFKIDPTKPNLCESPNGSSVEIPANVLVFDDGKPVTEPVEIEFNQYHSMSDIIASGIPMSYDSAGVSGNFVSGGMFSLYGRSNDKEVFIKEGETINVNLASDKSGPFNFYALNEETGDWTFQQAPIAPTKNPRYNPADFPIKPQKNNKDAFVLDLNFDLSDYSELQVFKGIVWEYVGNHDSLDPRKSDIVKKTRWDDFDLEPTYENAYEYWLTMKSPNRNFITKVRAALQGEDFENAMRSYKEKKKEIADKIDQLQKPLIRAVEISGFSTYNFDYMHDMLDPERIVADFDFGSSNKDKDKSLVFVLYPEKDVKVDYHPGDWANLFAIDKGTGSKILAILPDNKLAVFKGNIAEAYGKGSYTFKMDVHPEKLKDKGDLEKILIDL